MIAVVKDIAPVIRAMYQADVAAVTVIERETYEYPWTAGIFRDCLLAGYTCVVLDQDGAVAGYGILSVAAGEAHLLNICVARPLRRRGVGRRLLEYLLSHARTAGAERVFLEVRPSNRAALSLYRQTGFHIVGVRKGYYKATAGSEDAVVLVHHFPTSG